MDREEAGYIQNLLAEHELTLAREKSRLEGGGGMGGMDTVWRVEEGVV